MCILHNSIYNSNKMRTLTEKQQNPPIKVKMKIGDIEFEIEAQPDQIQNAVNKILTAATERLKTPTPTNRTPRPPAQSRNMQRHHPKTLGRKLVQPTPRLRRRPLRTRTQRVPLRPYRSRTRTRRPCQRQHPNTNRQTTQIPIRTKKTPNIVAVRFFVVVIATVL